MKLLQNKYLILLFSVVMVFPLWAQQDIIGTWNINRDNTKTTMTFYENKTVEFFSKTGWWNMVDDLLILVVNASQVSYTWQISDNIIPFPVRNIIIVFFLKTH